MSSETVPQNEAARLEAVREYDILDTPSDGAFDRVARLAARFFDVPIATVSIVDQDRIWFKARHGLDAEQIGRDPGLCASVILQDDAYVVTDAIEDPRTLENPLVRGDLGLRFYAAAPIKSREGHNLGTINVMDTQPRDVTDEERRTLAELAAMVADELELRLRARSAVEAERSEKRGAERVTSVLQERLLPGHIPEIPRLHLATYYEPVSPVMAAGGDFFDVFDLQDNLWGLAIGDVCGKGPGAAALTGEIRHMLRALARVHTRPSNVLGTLNQVLHAEGVDEAAPGERFCTATYLLLDASKDPLQVTLCNAGHPLPLIRRATGTVERAGEPGQLLGPLPNAALTDHVVTFSKDDTLLLYTDGAVEQQGTSVAVGEERLERALQTSGGTDAAQWLTHVRQAVEPTSGMNDDVAMVLARIHS